MLTSCSHTHAPSVPPFYRTFLFLSYLFSLPPRPFSLRQFVTELMHAVHLAIS